jgi:predicted DCC family thiol-disulfide oxidoreductase YuxK
MKSAWTGGQYSLFRFALGLTLGLGFWASGRWPEAILAALFTLGIFDRPAALLLAGRLSYWPAILDLGTEFDALLIATVLLAHCWLPTAPFGSLAARGRINPDNGWTFPLWISGLLWIEILLVYLLLLLTSGQPIPIFGLLWLHLSALGFCWIPPARSCRKATIFFDGECGLCHGVVRWVLAEDGLGTFYFSPLQGTTYVQEFNPGPSQAMPNTVLLWIDQKRLLSHSDAVLCIMAGLGGLWRVSALGLRLIPRAIRDLGYRWVARVRTRLYPNPEQSCPMLPPELGTRFYP